MSLPIEAEMDRTSIVLVGAFNPAIFQPMWFAANDMLSREDAETAAVNIVHPDITHFKAKQVWITVEQNRFVVNCETIHRNIIRDLVLSCFGNFLVHTPISMMGLNRELHFSCGTEARRSKFGFALAPPDAWGPWGTHIAGAAAQEQMHGGMVRIQMRESPRTDGYQGYIQAEIQPSNIIRGAAGIFVQINNHFQISPETDHPALGAVEALEASWDQADAKAQQIIGDLMIRAAGEKD